MIWREKVSIKVDAGFISRRKELYWHRGPGMSRISTYISGNKNETIACIWNGVCRCACHSVICACAETVGDYFSVKSI